MRLSLQIFSIISIYRQFDFISYHKSIRAKFYVSRINVSTNKSNSPVVPVHRRHSDIRHSRQNLSPLSVSLSLSCSSFLLLRTDEILSDKTIFALSVRSTRCTYVLFNAFLSIYFYYEILYTRDDDRAPIF